MDNLTVEYRRGYWCVCHDDKVIISFKSRTDAQEAAPEAKIIEREIGLTDRRESN